MYAGQLAQTVVYHGRSLDISQCFWNHILFFLGILRDFLKGFFGKLMLLDSHTNICLSRLGCQLLHPGIKGSFRGITCVYSLALIPHWLLYIIRSNHHLSLRARITLLDMLLEARGTQMATLEHLLWLLLVWWDLWHCFSNNSTGSISAILKKCTHWPHKSQRLDGPMEPHPRAALWL